MSLAHLNVLLTGASGGIGRAIAGELLSRGAAVLLTGRDAAALDALVAAAALPPERCRAVAADLADPASRGRLLMAARTWNGGVNTLINNAGIGHFGMFGQETADDVDKMLAANVAAPMLLCSGLLPHFASLPEAHVLNVGSVFGSIGYPGHAVYSATKFALRGFSEALHRELSDTRIRVHYLAPRATRTSMNVAEVEAMNAELGVAVDPPERVAQAACDMLERGRARAVVGWPEKFFARLNAALPGVVDRALRGKLADIRRFATMTAAPAAATARLQDHRRKAG